MNVISSAILVAAATGLIWTGSAAGQQAKASDLSVKDDYAAPASIWGPGWMIRARGIGVIPDEDGTNALSNVDISDTVVPELDISYFFTKNIALELILAVTPHDIDIPGGNVGDVWLLPPTLTLQYHFDMGKFKPYVGAGVNYTVFFNEDDGIAQDLEIDNSFGWALQAGFDYHLEGNWFFNVDVKKLWLDTDWSTSNVGGGDVDVDPWIIGVGFGYKFGAPAEPLAPLK